VWGEGASDLWGRVEWEDDGRDAGLPEAVRQRLRGSGSSEDQEAPEPEGSLASLETAA
jgi:hypothetical protein